MSLSEMTRLASNSGLAKNDAQWWPKWMEAYFRSVHQVEAPLGGSKEAGLLVVRIRKNSRPTSIVERPMDIFR